MEGLCSGLGGLRGLADGGGVFWRDGWLRGSHGFSDIGDGVDGCISAAEERGEGRRASAGDKAGGGGAEGCHCE